MRIRRDNLNQIDFSDVATGRRLAPVHPGEVLAKDFSLRGESMRVLCSLIFSPAPLAGRVHARYV